MKIAPIIHAIERHNSQQETSVLNYRLIHTGQHYDERMSARFFDQLNIPKPDINLGVGSGTQAEQTGAIMVRYEAAINEQRPVLTMVVGDVTSTMACTIVAKKAGVKVAHVEAGIRSGDMRMPEEINRLVTDRLTDLFFTTSELAGGQLIKEGIDPEQIHWVGNTMIDSLLGNKARFRKPAVFDTIDSRPYIVGTLHRPANVDDPKNLEALLFAISAALGDHVMVFPMHPRTQKAYDQMGRTFENILVVEPLGYLEFMYLVQHAKGVITDSGGITEETTVLGVPCLTLRDSTERPETISMGTNVLGGIKPSGFISHIQKMVAGDWKTGQIPPLWDGKTAERIVAVLTGGVLDCRKC